MYFSLMVHYRQEYCFFSPVHESTSLETQGQIVGARESLNRRKNMAQKKSKERPEEPLGTMSYQTLPENLFLAPIRSQNGGDRLELALLAVLYFN